MQMSNKHMKRYSTSPIIREMQIKTTMRYYPTLVRKAIIKKSTNSREGVEKMEPSCTAGGNLNWYSHHGEQYGGSFKKTRGETTTWPSSPACGHTPWGDHEWLVSHRGYTIEPDHRSLICPVCICVWTFKPGLLFGGNGKNSWRIWLQLGRRKEVKN